MLEDWLFDHLVDQGAKQLPLGCCEFRDGEWYPRVDGSNEKEVRACFLDEAQFERFHSGKDYSNGLATVTDADFNVQYGWMVEELNNLLDTGKIRGGSVVRLDTLPVPFLQDAPMVKGKWLDRYVVELAE